MQLIDVRGYKGAADLLWQLMEERPRESWISHQGMPSREAHEDFVASHPFRYWLIVEEFGVPIGAIEVTDRNEIGLQLLRAWRGRGLGTQAMLLFFRNYKPLPAIPAVRSGRWLANIASGNGRAKGFWLKLDFTPIQETWQL